jgi:hypothetical protein
LEKACWPATKTGKSDLARQYLTSLGCVTAPLDIPRQHRAGPADHKSDRQLPLPPNPPALSTPGNPPSDLLRHHGLLDGGTEVINFVIEGPTPRPTASRIRSLSNSGSCSSPPAGARIAYAQEPCSIAKSQKTLDTAVAKQVVDAVNAYIERVTHRCWGDSATITEQYDYASQLWLRHQDVQTVNSVKSGYPGEDLVDIDDTDFSTVSVVQAGLVRGARLPPRLYRRSAAIARSWETCTRWQRPRSWRCRVCTLSTTDSTYATSWPGSR